MATDIVVGGNRTTLTTIASDWNTAAEAAAVTRALGTRRPGGPVGLTKEGTSTFTGNASTTAFVVTHGAGFTPSKVRLFPKTTAAAGPAWASTFTPTQFTINFVTAPAAAANNVVFDWEAIK